MGVHEEPAGIPPQLSAIALNEPVFPVPEHRPTLKCASKVQFFCLGRFPELDRIEECPQLWNTIFSEE